MLNEGDDWQVWKDWYQARLAGDKTINVPDDLLERVDVGIATLDEALWNQGPAVVNAEIKRLMDEAGEEATKRAAADVPPLQPASIKPVWKDDVLILPSDAVADDLSGASIEAALASLKDKASEFVEDLSAETNVDLRAVRFFEKLRDKTPETNPNQQDLFSFGHDEEMFAQLASTHAEEWSPIVSASFHALRLHFERTIEKFPEWRAFKAAHGRDNYSEVEIEAISSSASELADELKPLEEKGTVSSNIAAASRAFSIVLTGDSTPDEIATGNDLLAADTLEVVNNVLKSLASWALGKAKIFAKSFDKGLDKVLDEAGSDLSVGVYKLVKKALKAFVVGGSAAGGGATIVTSFPKAFEWLKPAFDVLVALF